MELPAKLYNQIVDFLKSLPSIDDSESQRAFIYKAGLDQQLQNQIQFGKPLAQFIPLLVSTLIKYGRLNDGRHALEAMLVTAKKSVGQGKKVDCDILIQELQTNLVKSLEDAIICPYRGLLSFKEQDRDIFFGREVFTDKLFMTVQNNPIVSVIGPSGSGKSSVVFAGLVPLLRKQKNWLIINFSPGFNPFHELARALERLLEEMQHGAYLSSNIETSMRPNVDVQDTIDHIINAHKNYLGMFLELKEKIEKFRQGESLLQEIVQRILKDTPSSRLLIIADQFEELYTLCRNQEIRRQFLYELLSVKQFDANCQPLFNVAITLRADFLNKALSEPYFSLVIQDSSEGAINLCSNKLLIGAMSFQELRSIIEKPAHKVGLELENGLTECILDSISREPGNLPLLEFALLLLWERRSNKRFTKLAYRAIGGVEKSLALYAEGIYEKFSSAKQKLTRDIFVQLVQPGENTEDTRRIATRNEIGMEGWNFVTAELATTRLVVTEGDERTGEKVMLVHESLMQNWERLRHWINEDRSFRTWQERLRFAMKLWEEKNKDDGALLHGALLDEAKQWLKERDIDLNQAERSFIQSSIIYEQQITRRQTIIAESTRLTEQAKAIISKEPQVGLLLAAEAMNIALQEDMQLENILWKVLGNLGGFTLKGHEGAINAIAISSDSRYLFSVSVDGTLRQWDLTANNPSTASLVLSKVQSEVTSVTVSSDNRWIAIGSIDGNVRLWKLQNRSLSTSPIILNEQKGAVHKMFISPDNHWMIISRADQAVQLWNLATIDSNKTCYTLSKNQSDITTLAISPDGQWMAASSVDGTLLLWDLHAIESSITPSKIYNNSEPFYEILISSDNRWLIGGGRGHAVKLWNLSAKDRIVSPVLLYGHDGFVYSAAISSDNRWLLTGSYDNTAHLWDLHSKNPTDTSTILQGHKGCVCASAISPDGRWGITGSMDTTVRLWDLQTENPSSTSVVLHGHKFPIEFIVISPDNHWLITASRDNTLRLWALRSDGLSKIACLVAGRNLSNVEWNKYFPKQKYREIYPGLPIYSEARGKHDEATASPSFH